MNRLTIYAKRKKIIFVVFFLTLLTVGSAGFYVIGIGEKEPWNVIDSIYMTVITLSTVGFEEVHSLSQLGKIWAMVVIVFGVSGFAVLISQIGSELIEFKKYRKRKMSNKIKKLKNHYILCGYGRMGAVIAEELYQQKIPFTIIEIDEEKTKILDEKGYLYLQEDATLDETLIKSGIKQAKGVVITLNTDQDNLFVTMSARNLNPNANLLSRCSKQDTGKKLKRAGANKVVNPYITGGHKMAELLISPFVEDSVLLSAPQRDLDMVIDEINLSEIDLYDGIMIKDSKLREDFNLIIVGLIDENGKGELNPDPHTILNTKQTIMVLGSKEKLEVFKKSIPIEN